MYSDCWSDVLRSHYNTDLVLFHDYRKGLYSPGLDQYGRAVAMAADAWQSGVPGKAIVPRSSGWTSVADGGVAPELRLTAAGTIVVFIRPGGWDFLGGRRIMYKVTGANGYDFASGNSTQLMFTSGGLSALDSVGIALAPCRSVGVSWTSGVAPEFYGNGNFRSNGTNVAAPTAEQSTLYIGNAAGGLLLPQPIQSVVMFSIQLTGAEISQLHNDFMASGHYL